MGMPSGVLRSSKLAVPSLTERASFPGIDQLGHEQIFVAVVVEIAGIDAHVRFTLPVRSERHSGQERGVAERSVVLVDPQLVLLLVVGDEDVQSIRRR